MSTKGLCKNCGSYGEVGDDGKCIWCEDTKEIKLKQLDFEDFGFEIVSKKPDDSYCTNCGAKKKWVTILQSVGPEWICPKC